MGTVYNQMNSGTNGEAASNNSVEEHIWQNEGRWKKGRSSSKPTLTKGLLPPKVSMSDKGDKNDPYN